MRRFRSIVQSADAPYIDSIWITNDNKIKYFNGNGWVRLGKVLWDDIEDKPNISENLPNATTKKAGCVRKGTGVQNLSNDAGISDIISTINNLLSSLRTAGILNSIIWEK